MQDFEIEVAEDQKEENHAEEEEAVQLPINFLTIGEIENDDVKVYIKQNVYKAMEEYASSDTDHELGTIMLGHYSEEMGKMHVIVSDYILAKYTDASASTLTFTHETWDYVYKEHDEKYPDEKIIGWQHTHPGYGIFLSNYDMFIQENFFNMPFQIAYVIDPVQHLRGFFQWKNGKVQKLKGFYIYDDLGQTIKIEQPKTKTRTENAQSVERKSSKLHIALTGVLAVMTICLLIITLSLAGKYSAQVAGQEELQGQIAEQNQTIAQQSEEITAMQGTVDAMQQAASAEAEQENSAGTASAESQQYMYFAPYTVQAGDTLGSICEAAGIDYSSTYRIILAVNGIVDANQIYVGQMIMLPVQK